MATMTYDPTPADQPELNAEEQDSLKVGEALQEQEEKVLAGKYKNAEELEKAYLELQSQFSKKRGDKEEPEPEVEENPPEEPVAEEQQEEPEEEQQEPVDDLSDEDVSYLKDLAGGAKGYDEVLKWASSNFSSDEIDLYDQVMESGSRAAAYFAVTSLVQRFQLDQDKDGTMLTGKTAVDKADVFRSQAQLVEAMSDPRYDKDPAYRADLAAKLERSDIQM